MALFKMDNHPGAQFVRVDRLADEIRGTFLKGLHAQFGLDDGGFDEDGKVSIFRVLAKDFAAFEAVHAIGHEDVEEDEVGLKPPDFLEDFLGAAYAQKVVEAA